MVSSSDFDQGDGGLIMSLEVFLPLQFFGMVSEGYVLTLL